MLMTKSKRTKKPLYNFHKSIPEELLKDQEFMNTWNVFVRHRAQMNKPLTERAVKLIFNKYPIRSTYDIDLFIKSLRLSIINGWQGVFPIIQ